MHIHFDSLQYGHMPVESPRCEAVALWYPSIFLQNFRRAPGFRARATLFRFNSPKE